MHFVVSSISSSLTGGGGCGVAGTFAVHELELSRPPAGGTCGMQRRTCVLPTHSMHTHIIVTGCAVCLRRTLQTLPNDLGDLRGALLRVHVPFCHLHGYTVSGLWHIHVVGQSVDPWDRATVVEPKSFRSILSMRRAAYSLCTLG